MPPESDKWGWKHVTVFGGFDKGSGTKRWKCNHCNLRYNGSYSRVRAHLLGFTGVGVKSCPAIDRSLREAFQILEEERVARKKKKASATDNKPPKRVKPLSVHNCLASSAQKSKEVVDDLVARFFYAEGLSINAINSLHFQEMVKAIANFGSGYELPSAEMISGSLLIKEKERIEKSVALIRDSWPHTGCTILCTGKLNLKFFAANQRGIAFVTSVNIDETNNLEHVFIDVLDNAIAKIGATNVFQIISDLDQGSRFSESLLLTRFPHIFWSPCTSRYIRVLMDEIAELDSVKSVVLCCKDIEQCILACSCIFNQNLDAAEPYSINLPSSYRTVQRIFMLKETLQEVVVSEEWNQWKLRISDNVQGIEAAIVGDEFWAQVHSCIQLFESFVNLLDKNPSWVMGDVHFWRFQAIESLKTAGTNDVLLNQFETLIETRWDSLFSPLHAAGYILNPRFFGKGQNKDKIVMRGWKAVLDKYECESTARRVIREELSTYWRLDGSFGEEDAMDCRDKMDPVSWWENFGFETVNLQTLAVKVLSQVPNVAVGQEIRGANDLSNQDLDFVHNSLRIIQVERSDGSGFLCNGVRGSLLNPGSLSREKAWDNIAHLDQTKAIVSGDY